ncbi:MAG: TIR domain-containing protein [Lachnospiraceae bacterium]|nr:TIR domain-containing protein [Lachnospiraceae bacterium]
MPDTQNLQTADDAALGIASEYDAFISYKHGPVDSAAAKALQKNLEHFHVPIIAGHAKGEKKRRKIKRVFLDEGELSATAAFASRIRLALKNSRWLIIICSPATKNSPWVDLEIRTFLEFHDRDHILAVMTSGEPADIFPEAFAGSGNLPDEMLAADARGATAYEVVKKLRGDTLLRIAAPILGMTYDDLKQRNRVYRLQRFLAAASVCLVAITGFLVYASLQNRKLSQSNRDIRLRQAELITNESSAQLEAGNSVEAIRGLLHVVTDLSGDTSPGSSVFDSVFGYDRTSEDVLPSSQYELTRALNLYVPHLTANFENQYIAPGAVLEVGETLFQDLLSDSDGTHLLAAGQKRVYVWDTATDQLCSEISFDEYILNWSEDALLDGDRIVLCGEHSVVCYNYLTGKVDWKITVLDSVRAVTRSAAAASAPAAAGTAQGSTSEVAADRLYLVSDSGITVLDVDSGALLDEYRFVSGRDESFITSYSVNSGGADDEEAPLFGTVMDCSVSEDGRYLLFTSREAYEQAFLYAHDLATAKTVKIDTVPYYDECFHAASYSTEQDSETEHVLYSKFKKNDNGYAIIMTSVALEYEETTLSSRQEWEKEIPLAQQTRSALAEGRKVLAYGRVINILPRVSGAEGPASILFACDEDLRLLSPQDGQILYEFPLPGTFMKFLDVQGHCFLYLRSGRIYDYVGKELQLYTAAFADNLHDIEKLGEQSSFYCLGRDNRIIHYSPDEPDLGFVKLASHDSAMRTRVLWQDDDLTLLSDDRDLCLLNEKEDSAIVTTYTELVRGARGAGATDTLEVSGNGADTPEVSGEGADTPEVSGEGDTLKVSETSGEGDTLEVSETSGVSDTSGTSDTSEVLYSSDFKVLNAENGIVHFLRVSKDSPQTSVLTHYQLNASDGTVTAEDILRVNRSFYMDGNILYDPDGNILYVMDSQTDATVIWTCSFDTSKVIHQKAVRHVLPLGKRYSFYSLNPQADKILLFSDQMDLLVLNANTWQTEYTISGTAYSMAAVNKLKYSDDHSEICWDGHTLVIPDKHKLHVYDDTGAETHTILCEHGTDDNTSKGVPCAALSPTGKCLYYVQNSTLVQYSLTDAKILNEITLPAAPDASALTSAGPWVVTFDPVRARSLERLRTAFPFPKGEVREPDTMHIVYNGVYYCVRCDYEAFGVMTQVNGVTAYTPASGKIFMSIYDVKTGLYDYIYYREYSIGDIIDIARERYSGL